jgi:lincosamide nucleotidyltransferase A/C/D/E
MPPRFLSGCLNVDPVSGTGDTASVWTRGTDRLNAVVWGLPLPRRPKVLLSQIVFHNPPMPGARVVETIAALDGAGLRTIIFGGWGIDALVGRQLRKHTDLDLLVETAELDRAIEVLGGLGYGRWNEDEAPEPSGPIAPDRTVSCRDRALRVVDLHGGDLDAFEPVTGVIGTREVDCLSAEQQLETQIGKSWTRARRRRRQGNLAALQGLLATKPG